MERLGCLSRYSNVKTTTLPPHPVLLYDFDDLTEIISCGDPYTLIPGTDASKNVPTISDGVLSCDGFDDYLHSQYNLHFYLTDRALDSQEESLRMIEMSVTAENENANQSISVGLSSTTAFLSCLLHVKTTTLPPHPVLLYEFDDLTEIISGGDPKYTLIPGTTISDAVLSCDGVDDYLHWEYNLDFYLTDRALDSSEESLRMIEMSATAEKENANQSISVGLSSTWITAPNGAIATHHHTMHVASDVFKWEDYDTLNDDDEEDGGDDEEEKTDKLKKQQKGRFRIDDEATKREIYVAK